MKKPKSIFFLVYFLFHVILLVVSVYVNYRSEDFEFLLWLREKMSLMVWVSAAGLLLFFINMIFSGMDTRSAKSEKDALNQEINALKAKMFDLQDATKPSTVVASSAEMSDDSAKNQLDQED